MKFRVVLSAFLLAGIPCLPVHVAQAQEAAQEPQKVLVGKLKGAKPTSARNWIIQGLGDDSRFEVVGEEEGLELTAGASAEEIAAAAAALQADAVILGRSNFGNGWSASLSIYDGKDGSLLEEVKTKGGSFSKYEAALVGGEAYFSVVEKATGFPPEVPEVEEPVDLEEEEEAPAPEPEPIPVESRPSPLDVVVGGRIYSRSYRYTDSLNQLGVPGAEPLTDYNLDAGPMPGGRIRWYPGAHVGGGALAHIGINAGFEQGIATNVTYIDEMGEQLTFGQNHRLFYAGLRGRIPFSIFELGLGGNFASHSFGLKEKGDGSPAALAPNISYSLIEMAADLEGRVGGVIFGGHFAYLLPVGLGDIATDAWFPNASAMGLQFGGTVGYEVADFFDLLVTLDSRAYAFDFNEIPTDAPADRVAGGATDRYLSVGLGMRFLIPGSDEGAAPAAGDSAAGASAEGEAEDEFGFD